VAVKTASCRVVSPKSDDVVVVVVIAIIINDEDDDDDGDVILLHKVQKMLQPANQTNLPFKQDKKWHVEERLTMN